MLSLLSIDPTPTFWVMIALWGIIFITTLIIELETSDLTTIWFCISSVATIICTLFGLEPLLQVVVFACVSGLLILATRPLTKKMMNKDIIHTNTDRLIGMVAVVTKDIIGDGIGEVRVDNNLWRAISNDSIDIFADEKVIITSLTGNKVVVSKIQVNKDIELI